MDIHAAFMIHSVMIGPQKAATSVRARDVKSIKLVASGIVVEPKTGEHSCFIPFANIKHLDVTLDDKK